MTAEATIEARAETLLAFRNVLKLGGSLLFTWGVAIVMRLVLPRYLGPARFGMLTFADAFTAAFLIALSLGVDVYARKHVSVRPEHASDFFGGTLIIRAVLALALVGVMSVVLGLTHRPAEVRHLVYILALAQFLLNGNLTLSAFLQSKGSVGGLSLISATAKIVWAVGLLCAIALRAGLWAYALAYVASEALKGVALLVLAHRHLGLVVRVDVSATKGMLVASLPYYLTVFATTAYAKLDLALVGVLGSDTEVGWYAAAGAIAALTLMLAPLLEWVLMPTFARAAARSHDELYERMRWATNIVLAIAVPASLLVNVGADLLVRTLFGAPYAQAALALRILTTTFVLTYINIIYAMALTMLERAWTLTLISIGGLVVNVGLNALLIPRGLVLVGEGGGGASAALALLGTEIFVCLTMLRVVGRQAFDRPTTRMLLKSLLACGVVFVVDHVVSRLGWARVAIDGSLYVALALATGALSVRNATKVVTVALSSRSRARRAPDQRG